MPTLSLKRNENDDAVTMFDSDSVVAVRSVVNGMMTPTARMDHPVVTTERTATTKSESNIATTHAVRKSSFSFFF